jgi:hypothetical protein
MIVDLETAKRHLRRTDDDDDTNIVLKLEQASAIVLDYLKLDADTYDIDASPLEEAPKMVEAATLLVLEALYVSDEDPLTNAVKSILHRSRDPALA